MDSVLEVMGQVASLIGGGGVLSILWTWQSDRLAQYRYLDESYSSLLEEYRQHPELGDPEKTYRYQDNPWGGDPHAYHYFAMTVHNVMETMFDILDSRPLDEREWAKVFAHHVALHRPWLEDNASAFELEYLEYVRREVKLLVPRDKAAAPDFLTSLDRTPATTGRWPVESPPRG